jgi:predicted DsbA family dithiol-disulfide isomerase
MTLPILELYGSIECPFAYLATYRLRRVWPTYAGRLQLTWRALALEYVNNQGNSRPFFEAILELFPQIEPDLPLHPWSRPAWDWPVTLWPAFEALACVQAQSQDAALLMSWTLRHAYFAENRNIALRHELFAIAEQVARETPLNLPQFMQDWDNGRYKHTILADSHCGWHELKLDGSATFVLPNGRTVTNPAIGAIDFDASTQTLRGYTPYAGDPLMVIRGLLDEAIERTPAS